MIINYAYKIQGEIIEFICFSSLARELCTTLNSPPNSKPNPNSSFTSCQNPMRIKKKSIYLCVLYSYFFFFFYNIIIIFF